MSSREFWVEIRRGFIAIVNALARVRPDDPLTLEIKIVERTRIPTST